MARELPTIVYKGRKYFVDFKLGEMRDVRTALPIRFVDLKEDVNSDVKKELRGIRSRTWYNEYVEGIDD
jgi:hypothetical protein